MALVCFLGSKQDRQFQDQDFPPSQSVLSFPRLGSVAWKRLPAIAALQGVDVCLFRGAPQPAHIKQGQLGDCWLLSALACLCREDGALEACFDRIEKSSRGRYKIRLFSCSQRRWMEVIVDDWLPCDEITGKLLFARAVDGSAWVPLLEKAVAKLSGGYGALHGGNTAWALRTLTGRPCFKYRYDAARGRWRRHELLYSSVCSAPTFRLAKTKCFIDGAAMLRLLLRQLDGGAFVAASSGRSPAALQPGGGVRPGHAYAVMGVSKARGGRFLKLWVPAGDSRLATDMSLGSKTRPSEQSAGPFVPDPATGILWMSWIDFCSFFYTIEFCTDVD